MSWVKGPGLSGTESASDRTPNGGRSSYREAVIEVSAANSRAYGPGSTTYYGRRTADSQSGPRRAAIEAAAALLGTDPVELSQRVRSGERLAEIAADVHVSSEQLKTVMAEAITDTASPKVAQRMLANLGNVVSGSSKPHHAKPTEPPPEALKSLATKMDMKTEQLQESIENGSFRELLADSGVEARLGILINKKL